VRNVLIRCRALSRAKLLFVIVSLCACAGVSDPVVDASEGIGGLQAFGRLEMDAERPGGMLAKLTLVNLGATTREFTVLAHAPLLVRFLATESDSTVLCEPCGSASRLGLAVRVSPGGSETLEYFISAEKLDSLEARNYNVQLEVTTAGRPRIDLGYIAVPFR